MMMTLHDITLELTTAKTPSKYKDCCALILRSEGSSFCAGADFHLASSIATPEQGVLMAELMTDTLTRLRYVHNKVEKKRIQKANKIIYPCCPISHK